jgi:predicted lipoprotein with Yx(FWY)xxD motif
LANTENTLKSIPHFRAKVTVTYQTSCKGVRMKYKPILAAAFVLTIILTACGSRETTIPTLTAEPTMAATEPAATEPPATETAASPEATNTEGAETATAGVPVTGEPAINVSESTGFGPILVDDEGLSLYLFAHDTQSGESSNCNDDCAIEWPPLLTQGAPVASEGVDGTLLGLVTREDGSLQVTYNGWPLYRFHGDATLGDTNGQGLDGAWFLITPTGEAVQQ